MCLSGADGVCHCVFAIFLPLVPGCLLAWDVAPIIKDCCTKVIWHAWSACVVVGVQRLWAQGLMWGKLRFWWNRQTVSKVAAMFEAGHVAAAQSLAKQVDNMDALADSVCVCVLGKGVSNTFGTKGGHG